MSDTSIVAETSYIRLLEALRVADLLGSVSSTLSWDQETMLPRGGT
ncbi:MAG: hypothetical protein H0U67_00730, partial [Gemmatimonadetes bacterium]|nr:hypothetical protein [Gemmatimonadota bacterium]